MNSLQQLLAPVGVSAFVERHAGGDWLHIPGIESKFADIMTWRSFNALLQSHVSYLMFPALRVVLEGRVLPESLMLDVTMDHHGVPVRRISTAKLKRHTDRGATIVITAVDEFAPAVRSLSDRLALEFEERIQVNAYFSPGGARGFQVHYDTHDVLVLQMEGQKQWDLYGVSFEFPIEGQSYTDHRPPRSEPSQVTLTKGDVLYVPRGCWHAAVALGGPSLHLTVGIYRQPRLGLVEWLMYKLSEVPAMRQDLASAFSGDRLGESIEIVREQTAGMLRDPEQWITEFEQWREERRIKARPSFNYP